MATLRDTPSRVGRVIIWWLVTPVVLFAIVLKAPNFPQISSFAIFHQVS